MSPWVLWPGAFVAGVVVQFALEVWDVQYTHAVNGRYARLTEEQMTAKVGRARKWWLMLFALGAADTGSVFGGPVTYGCLCLGAACGGHWGLGHAMWQKWRRLNGGKPDEGEADD